MTITIRPETPADIDAIDAITRAAFLDAPHTGHNEQLILKALRNAGALTLSLVAQDGDTPVGHVAVSPVSISGGAAGWFGLGPISVLPPWQGRGIGSQLMMEALERLETGGAAGCVLLGDPAYYRGFGFRPQPGLVLPGVPPEYFQARSFGNGYPEGVVTYHVAFNE